MQSLEELTTCLYLIKGKILNSVFPTFYYALTYIIYSKAHKPQVCILITFSLFFNFLSFLKRVLFIFEREGKGGRKRGRKTSMCERSIDQLSLANPQQGTWPTTQPCALTGNQTSDTLVHRPSLNPLSHTSQGLEYY